MVLRVKSRKITNDSKKGRHEDKWTFNNERRNKFDHLANMVSNRVNEEIMSKIKAKTECFSNKKEFCWEVRRKNGEALFKITINFISFGNWIFSVFSYEKKLMTYSEDLEPKSLSLAIEPHFE